MRLKLVRKEDLTASQLEDIETRMHRATALEGVAEPTKAWFAFTNGNYAFVTIDGEIPIAMAAASGRPTCSPGWWVDPDFRGLGYGNELVDLLAEHLRADSVEKIGRMLIDTPGGNYNRQSSLLVQRLRRYFPEEPEGK